MADVYLFAVEGKTFALGLFWQPLSAATPAERHKEVGSLARELSFDLAVTRNSTTHCVGFAKTSQSVRAGVFSAAAIVSKTLEIEQRARDFIFVSPLPDGKWAYVAQKDGMILSDGDTVFASEDAARAHMLGHMSLGDWQVMIAPSIWGISNTTERNFIELIPRKKNGKIRVHKWWRLMPVDRRRAVITAHAWKIVLLASTAAVAISGGVYYKKWKTERDAGLAAEADAAAAKQATAVVQNGADDQAGRPENPWKSQPLAGDMAKSCIAALAGQRLFPGNWDLSMIECAGGQLRISWKPRAGGWIKHLKEIVPSAEIAEDGSSASVVTALPELQTGYDEDAPMREERLIHMYSTAQLYGVTFGINDANPVTTLALPGQEVQAPRALWREIKWTVDGAVFPGVVLAALDGPGFRMNSMRAKWVDGKFVWTMEGTQYVQP